MRRLFPFAFVFLLLVGCGQPAVSAPPRVDSVTLHTASGDHVLKLEVAATEDEWERGLMYRKKLDGIDGMLFLFTGNEAHAMWMMNTYIPLDILFLDRAGAVTTIHRDAKPQDLTPLPSKGPARGAIELNAGAADTLGIAIGDKIAHPYFGG
jgi:uncharacterized membrane protein (UPF0127 family)